MKPAVERLARHIELVERALKITGVVLYPDDDRVSVSDATLDAIAAELKAARGEPTEFRLIDDEAEFVVKAAQRVNWHREAGNEQLRQRWQRFGEMFSGEVALDLQSARKSLQEIAE